MGTVAYMSPEQARGEPLDVRTDLFSFGLVLYEMATGKQAFAASSIAAVFDAILNKAPVSPLRLNPELPPELERIISKALEKDRNLRYRSAAEMRTDLQRPMRDTSLTSGGRASLPAEEVGGTKARPTRRAVIWAGIALFGVLAVLAILSADKLRDWILGQRLQQKIESVAVLPLKNLSGDPKQEYFSDGMTEELITTLARISALRVISRTSVMEYKAAHKSLPEIAKELNVDAIVEGSVLQSGNRVRITAQLVQGKTDQHLWADTYERDMTDILALQNDVARSIADEIQIKLTPQDQARLANAPTVHPEAYQAYLRGLEYSRSPEWSEQNFRLAIEMFERAVELDPKFTLAYTELSMMHSKMVHFGFDISEERLKKAMAAVDQAFALQPDLPEGHLALGYYHYWGHKDYQPALKELTIASRDIPNNPSILYATAAVQRRQGDFPACIENFKKAFELNPRSGEMAAQLGTTYILIRRYSEAERWWDRAISLSPDASFPYRAKATNDWLWTGSTAKSRATLEKMPKKQETTRSEGGWFWQELYERDYQAALDLLSSTSEVPFKGTTEFVPRAELAGMAHQLMKEPKKALASFDSARLLLEGELRKRSDDPRVHSSLGIVYAGLGRKEDAIREGKLAVQLYPVSKDAMDGPNFVTNLALVYLMTGEYDLALDQIDYLLSIPGFFSVSLLQLDPRWDPLRTHPRYAQLLQKYQHEHN
jgi:TolB-like protein/Flp pilus assembly protein TadD